MAAPPIDWGSCYYLSFMASCSFPFVQSVSQGIVIQRTLPGRKLLPNSDTPVVAALIAQRDEAYSHVIAQLAKEENVKFLNLPIPVQFQAKTIRNVQLKNQEPANFQQKRDASTPRELVKPIALTFDDGPWPEITSQVLDVLKKNNVKATFFVVGKQVQKHPQLLRQVVAQGHAIGNHTWSHQYHQYDEAAAAQELDEAAALVYKITGVKTSLFRPPAGILNNGLVAIAHQKKYAVVLWSVDSKDWRYQGNTPQSLVESVIKDAKPGGIILLHDGGGDRSTTVKALPQLITQLKKHGYTLVTVPELLEMNSH
jgi:chitin deacetylase